METQFQVSGVKENLDVFEDLVSREFGNDKPYNVFLSIEKFCEFYKKIKE